MKILSYRKSNFAYIFALAVIIACTGVIAAGQAYTPAKIAVINSGAFMDPKAGITRLVKAMTDLNTEFKPKQDELNRLTAQADTLAKDITTTANVADPKTIAQKQDQLEQLKLDIKRKGEDAQESFNRKVKTLTEPIQTDVGNALEAYAKKRGIDIIFDMSQNPNVFVFNNAVDITAAFIAEYNAKPVTP